MKLLHPVLFTLLCYLCGLAHASASSSDEPSDSSGLSGSSNDSAMMLAAADIADLGGTPIVRCYAAELAMESVSFGTTFAAILTHFACSVPELLAMSLLLLGVLHAAKSVPMVARMSLMSESAATAAGPVNHLTPNLQMAFATVIRIADFSRTAMFLLTAFSGHFCEIGAHRMTASTLNTLHVAFLMSFVWMGASFVHMAVWAHDIKNSVQAETLQA